jgi:hypothetical protein
MLFHPPPTEAEIRYWRAQARRHEQAARLSGRAQVQAELPRGQREVFQVKIVLEDSKPPIWRRVLIPANLRLPDLHGVVQLAMGWHASHLYHFMVGLRSEGLRFYGDPDPLDIDLIQQAEGIFINDLNVPIDHLLVNRKDWIRYEYDFGDGWIHRLTLEDIHVQPLKLARLPRCVAGKRACPPEDSGGVAGYEQALAILANPAHPEHQELLTWIGPFDPHHFDLEAVNADLVESFDVKPKAPAEAPPSTPETPLQS